MEKENPDNGKPMTVMASSRKKEIATELRADLKELEAKYGLFPDSAKLIRETRDARG